MTVIRTSFAYGIAQAIWKGFKKVPQTLTSGLSLFPPAMVLNIFNDAQAYSYSSSVCRHSKPLEAFPYRGRLSAMAPCRWQITAVSTKPEKFIKAPGTR